jgi:hypothetical protein
MTNDVDNKDAKIAELEARIKALEIKTQPPPKVAVAARLEGHAQSTLQLIDRMSVPQHILREMQSAVPDDVVREIAKDGRRR